MVNRFKPGSVVALAALALAAAPAMATTALNVAVGAGARAIVGASDIAFNGQIPAAWGGPGTLGIGFTAVAGDDTYSVTSSILVEASWLSAESGTLAIDWGRSVAGTAASQVDIFAGTNNAPDIDGFPANWFYEFTATGNGVFQGTYDITAIGSTFGLQSIYLTGAGFLELGGGVLDPTGSGAFAIPLSAGQTYRLSFWNFGNIATSSLADITGVASARINWEIVTSPVIPEPGTWALLIAGFGLVGGALRRRERPQVLSA